jgi:hypothetical protein
MDGLERVLVRNANFGESAFDPGYQSLLPLATLQVAVRLYREEAGRPAERLDELVPKYLPAVPADPFDGHPIRYRISKGEEIDWPDPSINPNFSPGNGMPSPSPQRRTVPAGYGILWCVADDGRDDGGHAQRGAWTPPHEEDLISLVPMPPSRR